MKVLKTSAIHEEAHMFRDSDRLATVKIPASQQGRGDARSVECPTPSTCPEVRWVEMSRATNRESP